MLIVLIPFLNFPVSAHSFTAVIRNSFTFKQSVVAERIKYNQFKTKDNSFSAAKVDFHSRFFLFHRRKPTIFLVFRENGIVK